MTNANGGSMLAERNNTNNGFRQKFGALIDSETTLLDNPDDDELSQNRSKWSPRKYGDCSNNASPCTMSPWNYQAASSSPFNKSPWLLPSSQQQNKDDEVPGNGLVGSLVRKEGHVYSLAVSGDLLYTGSDSKNIRVWKDLKDFTGFKSSSGLVKTIVISGGKIFTGHQDGKIRVWKVSSKNPSNHKRIGSLPTFKEYVKSSMNPKNYVEVRRNRNAVKVKHFDAVSSLSLDEEEGLLYSGSWDKTLKVWRLADSKCLDSINAHDDAVNAVVATSRGCILTGSADGMVKVWKRVVEDKGKKPKHVLDRILLKQENAVTALAVNPSGTVVYCGSSDGLVNFWERDAKSGFSRGDVLRGHKLAVLCLATAGNFVFSGSADKNVCVWKRDDNGFHTCHSVLTGHTGPVKCIAVEEKGASPEKGTHLCVVYTGSLDKSIKVWRVSEHAPDSNLGNNHASDNAKNIRNGSNNQNNDSTKSSNTGTSNNYNTNNAKKGCHGDNGHNDTSKSGGNDNNSKHKNGRNDNNNHNNTNNNCYNGGVHGKDNCNNDSARRGDNENNNRNHHTFKGNENGNNDNNHGNFRSGDNDKIKRDAHGNNNYGNGSSIRNNADPKSTMPIIVTTSEAMSMLTIITQPILSKTITLVLLTIETGT